MLAALGVPVQSTAVYFVTEVLSPSTSETQVLSRLRFFDNVSEGELASLARSLRRRTYKKGEVVYHQEDPPGSLFIVVKGIVKMQLAATSGKNLTIGWITAGGFFGTMSVLKEGVRPENAVALEPCELLVMGRDQFRSFLRQHPETMDVLLDVVANRWRLSIERLRDVVFLDVPSRIAKELVRFATRTDPASPDGASLVGKLNQHELAALAGTSRESVNKWLQFFARKGWVEIRSGRIRIIDQEALEASYQ